CALPRRITSASSRRLRPRLMPTIRLRMGDIRAANERLRPGTPTVPSNGEDTMVEDEGQLKRARFDILANDLHVAGQGYLRLGLDHMHRPSWAPGSWSPPDLTNLAIGDEAMSKTVLV